MLAAIDIGSNAVRVLFGEVIEHKGKPTLYKKRELLRMPIRLGEDSFLNGKISRRQEDRLVAAMNAFSELKKVFEVKAYRACATSAMRDASNGRDVIERIKAECGVRIEIIDGKTEAELIFANHIEETLNPKDNYLYIDVGGGSTELTLISNSKVVNSRSFNVGTIRMLHQRIDKDEWDDYKRWIRKNTEDYKPLIGIGSGGNINKLYKMTAKKDTKYLSCDKIREMSDMINAFSYEERIEVLGLNPDRADVIVPATKIFLTAMKHAEIEKIIVPQIGFVPFDNGDGCER
ncbi:MAG: exopolyphosphatase [Bacteroidia bacterium]|nr:exopolyphosphatase [Bacteroidia bacterium]